MGVCLITEGQEDPRMYSAIITVAYICVSDLKGCLDKQHVLIIRCHTELLHSQRNATRKEHDDKSLFVGSVG